MMSVQLQLCNQHDVARALEAIRRAPPRAFVTISEGPPSLRQKKAYWAILRDISEVVWRAGKRATPEQWHEIFAGALIGYEDVEWPGGIRRRVPLSINTLTWREFADYVLQIEALVRAPVDEGGLESELYDSRPQLDEFREQVR